MRSFLPTRAHALGRVLSGSASGIALEFGRDDPTLRKRKMGRALDKSLQDIEHSDWGDPAQAFGVPQKVLELRRVPVRELKAKQIALLLRQRVGLPTLVPFALDILDADVAPTDELYPGEWMLSVMEADKENHWHDIPEFRGRIAALVERVDQLARQYRSRLADGENPSREFIIKKSERELMRAWLAHPDTRTKRQKREQREQLHARWLASGSKNGFP
jgi:hypothetical protein